MVLEFEYQAYTISGKKNFKCTNIVMGTVDFDKFEMLTYVLSCNTVKVRRTPDNVRQRPNGHKRHDPLSNLDASVSMNKDLISSSDLEWMSINYRKVRATKLSKSKRRLILVMFQKDLKYFPTLREIRDQLIDA